MPGSAFTRSCNPVRTVVTGGPLGPRAASGFAILAVATLVGCGARQAAAPQPKVAGTVDEKIVAVDTIGKLGSEGEDSLASLVAALGDENPSVRWHAARAIGLVGDPAVSAIPQLVAALSDADPIVATQAAAAIGRIRSDDQRDPSEIDAATAGLYASAVKPLADAMLHEDARVRRAAIRALQVVHTDEDALIELATSLLADRDVSVVFPALHSLADSGDDAVPFLLKSLDHPKARYWATLALAEIGPAAAAAVPKLAALAGAGEPEERLQAIMALASIGEPAAAAIDPLLAVIGSKDAAETLLHPAAIYAVGRIRGDKILADKSFAAIEPFLGSDNKVLAATAAWARARIHPEDPQVVAEAVDRLEESLESPDATVRHGAVSGLSDLVDHLPPDSEKLLAGRYASLLSDSDPEVRRAAAVALVRLGIDAVPPVTAALADPATRSVATEIIAELGPSARPALPKLIEAIASDDPTTRSDAAFAIAGLGPAAADAVPALVERLEKEVAALAAADKSPAGSEPDQAESAPLVTIAYALGRIGTAAKPAAEMLHGLVGNPDPFIATVAAWSGLKIEPDRKDLYVKAVPLLIKALKSTRDLARLEAASTLGELGAAAADSIATLELVAEDDPVAAVRVAAEEALENIRKSM